MVGLDAVCAALGGGVFDCTDEYRLQAGCALLLASRGFEVHREVVLSPADRIDLLVGQIGIECKVDGSPSDVVRQCLRYLASARLAALVLVTGRARVGRMLPPSLLIAGRVKLIRVVETWKGSL